MTHLSSTLSDPLSQFQQFNWSLKLFSEADAPPTVKTAGSSALQSLTYSENEADVLSPIGSQCYSNQSSLSTSSSNESSAQTGGSAQLSRLPPSEHHEHSTEVFMFADSEKDPALVGPVSHPAVSDPAQNVLLRSSQRVFPRQRDSTTSELNLPSLSASSSNTSNPSSTLTRANSIAHSSVSTSQEHHTHPLPRSPTTLWMGDLESWMDEDYVRRCLMMTGWNLPHFVSTSDTGVKTDAGPNGVNVKIKMISGASPSSAYCFLTYPTAEMAEHAWRMISSMPPTLMPGCERTFKLNWATGLPGVQPTWDREFSVFIRDLDPHVTEGELVALFTCSFPSTKSAKIMGDLSTGLSRGYAFIRFGEESDMHRALALGRSKNGTGLFLRGRCIKITEASGSSGTAGDHSHHRTSTLTPGAQKPRTDQSAVISPAHRPDEHDIRLKSIPNARTMVNNLVNDNSKPSLRANREGFSQVVAGGLSSSSRLRPSSSHPPLSAGVTPSRAPVSPFAHDTINTNFCHNHDGLSQPLRDVSQLSSSMSALHLSRSYGHATKSAQIHSTQPNSTSLARAFTTSSSLMDRNQPIPTSALPSSIQYPSNLSHPICGLTAQGLLPSPQAPFNPHGTIFPSFGPSSTHPTTLSNHYMAPAALYPSSSEGNLSPLNQSYHPLHPAYDTPPPFADVIASPNSINSHLAALTQIASVANDASNDPSNTTVFVGGLPACISEGTLKTFFQNFGEITYVKIPPNKGCGFVQYARREDAQQAMLKMHDFPIHGKSRIRLSWGRSLGDKQVEYVKKLSSALGISFESVWKIVQGQGPSMIKQIASTLSAGNGSLPSLTPTVRHNSSVAKEHDQHIFTPPLRGVMPSMSDHLSNGLLSGPSIPHPNQPFLSPLPPPDFRGPWQGNLPGMKSLATSLNPVKPTGRSDLPVSYRGCRTTTNLPNPSFSYENITSAQGNVLRPFDKTWGFPL